MNLLIGLAYYPIWIVLFFSLIVTECYKLRETRDINPLKYNKLWHQWKGVYQLCILLLASYEIGWEGGLLAGVCYWILHDIFTNIIGLKMPWYYVGKTSAIDKFFNRPTYIFTVKVLLFITAIVTLFI